MKYIHTIYARDIKRRLINICHQNMSSDEIKYIISFPNKYKI